MSLEYLSELVIPRVTWTVGISCCRRSVRLIHFKGELGSTSHLILIDVTVLGAPKKRAQTDYYGWMFFWRCLYCRPTHTCILRTKTDFGSAKYHKMLCLLWLFSSPPLSLSCQSELGSGLGSNQSSWLGVSGSSCYKQPEVAPVANTI